MAKIKRGTRRSLIVDSGDGSSARRAHFQGSLSAGLQEVDFNERLGRCDVQITRTKAPCFDAPICAFIQGVLESRDVFFKRILENTLKILAIAINKLKKH